MDDSIDIPDPPERSDLKLWEQALRNDWPIPQNVKRGMLQTLVNMVTGERPVDHPENKEDGSTPIGGPYSDRTIIAAARVLAQFAALSLGQQKLDLERALAEAKLGSGKKLDWNAALAKAERLIADRRAGREQEDQERAAAHSQDRSAT